MFGFLKKVFCRNFHRDEWQQIGIREGMNVRFFDYRCRLCHVFHHSGRTEQKYDDSGGKLM